MATKLEEFHAEYYGLLIGLARRLCQTARWIDPGDLVQHALLRLVERGKKDPHEAETEDGETMNWLIKVMNNCFFDQLRSETSRQKAKDDPTITRYAHSDDDTPPTYERVSHDRFEWAIRRLPAKQRDTFLLRSQGLDNQEIARKLGISPGAVAQRLTNARHTLRKLLQPYVEQGIH